MIRFVLLISRQGKVRLSKWYVTMSPKERAKAIREVSQMIIGRNSKLCNFLEWRDCRIIWKRYASLYFVSCVDLDDNELMHLELIHHFVEVLDKYFSNVCELDLIYHFHRAYFLLDEVVMSGELQESSKKVIMKAIQWQESSIDTATSERCE